ncbi:hypothetical protein ACOME3_003072 [Neoechinorhynchus agilis]
MQEAFQFILGMGNRMFENHNHHHPRRNRFPAHQFNSYAFTNMMMANNQNFNGILIPPQIEEIVDESESSGISTAELSYNSPPNSINGGSPVKLKSAKSKLDFHGVRMTVDLFAAARNLIHYVQYVWPDILQSLVEDHKLVELATRAYIKYLTDALIETSNPDSFEETGSETPLNIRGEPHEVVRLIWVCHMIDSCAYYQDCIRMFGRLIGHKLPDNYASNSRTNSAFIGPKEDQYPREVPELSLNIFHAVRWLHELSYSLKLPHYRDEKFLATAVQRYRQFLFLLKAFPVAFITLPRPTDIMLVWMSHVLHPRSFRQDMQILLGKSSLVMLERVNLLGPHQNMTEDPIAVWREFFNQSCVIPGTLHRPNVPVRELFFSDLFALVNRCHVRIRIDIQFETAVNEGVYIVPINSLSGYGDLSGRRKAVTRTAEIDLKNPERHYKLVVRAGSWPKSKWVTLGTFDLLQYLNSVERYNLPFATRYGMVNNLGKFLVYQLETELGFRAVENFLGLKPLPPIVAAFAAVPPGTVTAIYVYQIEDSAISIHALPQFNTFLLFDGDRPISVCKQVPRLLLPHANQLSRPARSACFYENIEDSYTSVYGSTQSELFAAQSVPPFEPEACIILYDMNGDQAYIVFDKRQSSYSVKVFAGSSVFPNVETFPKITSSFKGDFYFNVNLSEIAKHGPSMFSCVLLASFAIHLIAKAYKHISVGINGLSRSSSYMSQDSQQPKKTHRDVSPITREDVKATNRRSTNSRNLPRTEFEEGTFVYDF